MDVVVLIARLTLAGVFLVAGLAKLADLTGSRQAVAGFGVPEAFARPLGVLLPLAELAVVVLLLPAATAWYGGLGAAGLLALFVVAIAISMARGQAPDCHCFGQLHSEPVGWPTLARNAALLAVALPIVARTDNQPALFGWLGQASGVEVGLLIGGLVLAGAVVGEGWLLLQLLQQNGRLLLRVEQLEGGEGMGIEGAPASASQPAAGLPVGSPAPAFALKGLHGEVVTLGALISHDKPVLLIFSDPGCGPCNALMPDVGRWQREHGGYTVALVSRGGVDINRAKASEHGVRHLYLQDDREVAESYLCHGTPGAVIIAGDGTIASPLAMGAEQIRALANGQLPPTAPSPTPRAQPQAVAANAGQPAPAVKRPDLDGKLIDLADFRGRDTAVLFWNPDCGFCQRMLDDLKAWEVNPPPGAPGLLLVSTGDAARNRAQGLKSTLILDDGFAVGQSFGASGTPSAVLVDAQGRINSAVHVGAPAVLALLSAPPSQDQAPAQQPLPAVKVGQLAPPLKLTDVRGKTVRISDFTGKPVMLVFWNPGCGFCQHMLDDLKGWETKRRSDAPRLLVISTGDAETNLAQGFTSPVVLDQGFVAGRAFGATGTPSAVLIDANGRVASEVAVGAEAVLNLVGAKAARA